MSQAEQMLQSDAGGVEMSETDQVLAKQKAVEARAAAQFERDKLPEKKEDNTALPVAAPFAQAVSVVAASPAPAEIIAPAPIVAPVVV